MLINNIIFYIDEYKELAYKFRITTKNQFEHDKMGFLKSRIACSTEFICNFAKVCYFLGCFFMFSWAKKICIYFASTVGLNVINGYD